MTKQHKASTGSPDLDDVLHGGLRRGCLHLVTGPAGSGKTTLGLQFLTRGLAEGETCLHVTLSQDEGELRHIARSLGLDVRGLHIHELADHDFGELGATEQTVFPSSEVELRETLDAFLAVFERIRPDRVVFDSVAELRLLSGNELGFRRRMLALRRYLSKRACTTLLLEPVEVRSDMPIRDIATGALELELSAPAYGEIRRSLKVAKMRGGTFRGGYHSFVIQSGGLRLFPRLSVSANGQARRGVEGSVRAAIVSSGIAELDDALGGGLTAGTSCLVIGPAGAGKSSVTAAFAHAAAERGEQVAIFLFEERPELYLRRSEALGLGLASHVRAGRVILRLIDTGEVSAGEFAHDVMKAADDGARLITIDSLTSFHHAMRNEDLLITQMHGLLINLSERGVLTLLTVAQHGVVGTGLQGPDISYLADNMMMLRHFEAAGTLRKAMSVVKRRAGEMRPSIHEIHFGPDGVRVGAPLSEFHGILTGTPVFTGSDVDLIPASGRAPGEEP